MSSLVEFMECENTVVKSKKIRIYPTSEQSLLLRQWIGTARFVYNSTVKYLEDGNYEDFYSCRKVVCHNLPDWADSIPWQVKAVSVRDACQAKKATRKKNKGVHPSKWHRLGFRSRKSTKQTIFLPSSAIKERGIYPRLLGEMKYSEELPGNIQDSRLSYENNQWFLIVPYQVQTTRSENQARVVALDPGIRSFQTFYNPEFVGHIGCGDIGRITRLCHHMDNLISKRDKSFGNQRYRINKAVKRMRTRIRNLIDELHHKTAKFLTDQFDLILIPSFDVIQMVKRGSRKLRSKSVRGMLNWAHYRFKCFLQQKCVETGKLCLVVNEAYTSKTRSWDGVQMKIGGSKTISDGVVTVNRDINGARNIFIKSVSRLLETLGDSPFLSQTQVA